MSVITMYYSKLGADRKHVLTTDHLIYLHKWSTTFHSQTYLIGFSYVVSILNFNFFNVISSIISPVWNCRSPTCLCALSKLALSFSTFNLDIICSFLLYSDIFCENALLIMNVSIIQKKCSSKEKKKSKTNRKKKHKCQ